MPKRFASILILTMMLITIEKAPVSAENNAAASSIYTSVNYQTSSAHIYGRLAQEGDENAMLIVSRPNGGLYHAEVCGTRRGQYYFKIGMDGDEGEYSVQIRGVKGNVSSVFSYFPSLAESSESEIDKYTTTYYAPWLLNWHMTKQNQFDAGYYGGEACQMSWCLAISPINSNIVMAGTDTNGLWKSTDGGKIWRSSSAGFNCMGAADIAFDPDDDSVVYALGSTGTSKTDSPYTGIYKSIDGGDTWTKIFSNCYYRVKNNHIIRFGTKNSSGTRRIFVGGHGAGTGAVYSDDEGETWNKIADGAIENYTTIDVNVIGDTIVFGTSGGIFVSYDNGETVTEKSPENGKSYTVSVNSRNGKWVCGSGNKVYESGDGGQTWNEIYAFAKEEGRVMSVSALRWGYGENPRLYAYIGLTHYPLRYSDDGGQSFEKFEKAENSVEFIKDNTGWGSEPFELDENNPETVIAAFDGEIYKSEDGGQTFFASSSGYSGMRASDFLFDENDANNIFITSIDRGVVRTIRGGTENYPLIDYDPSEDSTGIRYKSHKTMYAAARDPKDSQRIIVSLSEGILKESTDGGSTYREIEASKGYVSQMIEFNKDNPNTIYAGSIISYDNGKTWTASKVEVRAVSPFNGNTVYGASNGFAARSFDEGVTWETYGPNIGSSNQMICDMFEDGVIYSVGYSAFGALKIYPDGTPRDIKPSKKDGGDDYYGLAIAQDPKNQFHLISGGTDNTNYGQSGGIYETFDGGGTWRRIKGMPASRDVWTIEFHPNLPRVYIGTSAGTFVYEYEKYTDTSLAVTDKRVTEHEADGTDGKRELRYSMKIWNVEDRAYDAVVMLGAYSKSGGQLLNVANERLHLNALSPAEVSFDIEIDNEDTVLKAYVWDKNNITPLAEYDWKMVKNISADETEFE